MRSRIDQRRLSCLVLALLILFVALAVDLRPGSLARAGYQATTSSSGAVRYTATPVGPAWPSSAASSTRGPSPNATVTGSWAPSGTASTAASLGTPSSTPAATRRTAAPTTAAYGLPTATPTLALGLTPTLTNTLTPTATPTQAPIQLPILLIERDLIVNGSFESGQLSPYWSNAGTLRRQVVSTVRHGGVYSMLLGDPAYRNDGGCPTGVAAIYQAVEVPRTGQATLRFWYLMQSYDTKQFDYLAVIVASRPDLAATPVFSQGRTYWDEWLWSSGWREAKISLNAYRGQTIYVMLCNVMENGDGWYNTWTYVDDVRIDYHP